MQIYRKNLKKLYIFYMIGALFCLMIGMSCLYVGYMEYQSYREAFSFKKCKGQWIEKKVDIALKPHDEAQYRVYVKYEYIVNDKTYYASNFYRIELYGGEMSMLKKQALKELASLPKAPIVSYNPKDPCKSFIKMGSIWYMLICLITAMIAIPASLIFIF